MKKNKKHKKHNSYTCNKNSDYYTANKKLKAKIELATNPDNLKKFFANTDLSPEAREFFDFKLFELRTISKIEIPNDMEEFEFHTSQIMRVENSLSHNEYHSFVFKSYHHYITQIYTPLYLQFLNDREFAVEKLKTYKNEPYLDTIKNFMIYYLVNEIIDYTNSAKEEKLKKILNQNK